MKMLMVSLRALGLFTLLTGVVYPALVTVAASIFFPAQASGSLVTREGKVIGSALLAQEFKGEKYFWPRPSAIKYDGTASGGSNLSLDSSDLAKSVHERAESGAVDESRYSSASGLDPHLSPAAVRAQIPRVAKARGLRLQDLEELVGLNQEERQLGFLGEPRINVLALNLALDKAAP